MLDLSKIDFVDLINKLVKNGRFETEEVVRYFWPSVELYGSAEAYFIDDVIVPILVALGYEEINLTTRIADNIKEEIDREIIADLMAAAEANERFPDKFGQDARDVLDKLRASGYFSKAQGVLSTDSGSAQGT